MEGNVLNLRRLPLLWPVSLWVCGMTLARTDLFSPLISLVLLLLLTALLLTVTQKVLASVLMVAAFWGGADLLLDAHRVLVDPSWLSGAVRFTATVERVERRVSSSRLLLDKIVQQEGKSLSGKALLYSYGEQMQHVAAGQRIEASARFRLPRNHLNPSSFDYKSWCFDHQIALIGSLRGEVRAIDTAVAWVEMARQRVRTAIAGSANTGIMSALLLAERQQVSEPVSQDFSATGTAHLLAISGMHVGMVAAWGYALLWWLFTRREGWIVCLPVRAIALLGGFSAAFLYALIAGWPLPAVRASVMLAAAVLAWLFSSRYEPLNILLAALALILLVDPGAIVSLSLWLSFVATAALLLWGRQQERVAAAGWLIRVRRGGGLLLWSSLLAMLVTLPMIASAFGLLPLYGLPANLIMVPLYGLFVLPVALAAEVVALLGWDELAALLMQFSALGAGVGVEILHAIATLPGGSVKTIVPPLWLSLLYVLGLFGAGVLWWRKRRLVAALMLMFFLSGYAGALLTESSLDSPLMLVWDVGQGASSSILLPDGEVLVVDVPGSVGSRFNGGTTAAEALRSMGVTHTDVLILSHAQSDHMGGALSLIGRMNSVGEIWLPDVPAAREHRVVRSIMAEKQPRIRWLSRSQRLSGAGYEAEVLWPPKGLRSRAGNNSSLVLRLELSGGATILLPGDIEAAVERQLESGMQPVTVMLMPHHGSRSSSQSSFVETLSPELAIAQTGRENRYGFPDKRVLSRYHRAGSDTANTAEGAVVVALNEELQWWQWAPSAVSRRQMLLNALNSGQ